MGFTTVNPYTEKELATYDYLTPTQIQEALSLAAKTYTSWKTTALAHRKALLKQLMQLLEAQKQEHALRITQEMGKPIKEAMVELDKCLWLCQYYLEEGSRLLQPEPLNLEDKEATIHYVPTGAVLGIMPWNYPYWQVFRYVIPNVLAGNVTLLKHAPNTTAAGLAIEKLFEEAGFDAGVFQTLVIEIKDVEAVIKHPIVQGVCLTGSVNAGSAVAALAGKYLKKTVLELGSTDPFVILQDAPLDEALAAAFAARTGNAGQTCVAAKRIYIHQDQLKESIAFFKEKLEGLVLGDPTAETTNLGPIAKKEFVEKLENQLNDAIANGAELLVGGKADGVFFTPTLVISQQDNPINKEEVFGPILNIVPYEKEDDLPALANDSLFGLGAAIWSNDLTKANALADQIEAGNVVINGIMRSDPRIPFGGIKHSGYGREMGEAGIKSFLNAKAVVCNRSEEAGN